MKIACSKNMPIYAPSADKPAGTPCCSMSRLNWLIGTLLFGGVNSCCRCYGFGLSSSMIVLTMA
jgi:hypothetical protein